MDLKENMRNFDGGHDKEREESFEDFTERKDLTDFSIYNSKSQWKISVGNRLIFFFQLFGGHHPWVNFGKLIKPRQILEEFMNHSRIGREFLALLGQTVPFPIK